MRACAFSVLPDLVGCPTVLERVRPVAAARTCAPDPRHPAGHGRGESRSSMSRGPAPSSAAVGQRRGRIQDRARWPDRPIRPIRCRSGDYLPEGGPETAALSDFVALERAPGRLRARLGPWYAVAQMTIRGERRKGEVLITVDGLAAGQAVVAGGAEPLADGDRRGATAARVRPSSRWSSC